MEPLFPIARLSVDDVRREIRGAVDPRVDAARVADFLARVDWSNPDRASADVRAMLGELESWSTGHAEGDLSDAEYARRLQDLAHGRPAAR